MRPLALTFDNLGEAADLERGLWPADRPLGHHPSVTVALPRLLDALDELGLRATFCVEGLNCEHYPDAVAAIAARGHELALHGWRHERWIDVEPDREAALLERGRAAFERLGVRVAGFRPPGGETTPSTFALLAAADWSWCSPAAGAATAGGVASVPFAWPCVDAYHRLESFAPLRRARGDGAAPLDPAATADRLLAALARPDVPATLILHPFLMIDEAGFAAGRRVLAALRDLGDPGPIAGLADVGE